MARRRLFAVLCALALVAASCGDDDGAAGGDGGDGVDGGATSVTVDIDGRVDDFNASFFAYFPDSVTVHPGDTVVYRSVFTGEPHSIAFGRIVEDAVQAFRELTPEQLEAEGPPPPEIEEAFGKIPPMLPEGPGDAVQASVNPCFAQTEDEIPTDEAEPCEVTEPAPFTGTEAFYNSGFLPDGETFVLRLDDDIEPGTYVGFCTLHFTEMISEVTVVPADQEIPSADEVAAEGREQRDALAQAVAPAVEEVRQGGEPGTVFAGMGSEEAPQVLATEFFPGDVSVPAGEPVTWTIIGPHTVTFNASEDVRILLNRGDDGRFHLNPDSLAPSGWDAPPPPDGPPEGPPEPADAGEWDGTGFLNSGIMFEGEFVLRITEPGTYEYICLIHPEMEGTVDVS